MHQEVFLFQRWLPRWFTTSIIWCLHEHLYLCVRGVDTMVKFYFCADRDEGTDFYGIYKRQKHWNGRTKGWSDLKSAAQYDPSRKRQSSYWHYSCQVSLFGAKSHICFTCNHSIENNNHLHLHLGFHCRQPSVSASLENIFHQLSFWVHQTQKKHRALNAQSVVKPNLWAKFFAATRRIWSFNRIPGRAWRMR